MRWSKTLTVVGARAEAEVGRVVTGGVIDLAGKTMLAGRKAAPGGNLKSGTVIHPGRMDRSPCGTGTATRLAQLQARGELEVGRRVTQLSTIDSRFEAEILGVTTVGDRPAALPRISGRAWIYGPYRPGVDPSDPYPRGCTMSATRGPGLAAKQATTVGGIAPEQGA